MVEFKIIYNENGLNITISEGRKELEKALDDKQFIIPNSFSISFDNLHNFHYYIGKIRDQIHFIFGLKPEFGIIIHSLILQGTK